MGEVRGLRREQLILNDVDAKINEFDWTFNSFLWIAYHQSISERKNLGNYSPFIQKRIQEKTCEERFAELASYQFKSEFMKFSPASIGLREYDTILKEKMIEYAEEHYPFIEINGDCRRQVQYEQYGIQAFFHEGIGRIIYVNDGVYYIYAQLNKEDYRSEIEFAHPRDKFVY